MRLIVELVVLHVGLELALVERLDLSYGVHDQAAWDHG